MLSMVKLQISDTAPEGAYTRENFRQVMEKATEELEKTLGYAVLIVKNQPPNIQFNIQGPNVKIEYHMFGHHVQIQAVGKDEYNVGLVKEAVEKEIAGLEAKIAAA